MSQQPLRSCSSMNALTAENPKKILSLLQLHKMKHMKKLVTHSLTLIIKALTSILVFQASSKNVNKMRKALSLIKPKRFDKENRSKL